MKQINSSLKKSAKDVHQDLSPALGNIESSDEEIKVINFDSDGYEEEKK